MMYLETFNYDGKNATVIKEEKRLGSDGNPIIRTTLDNGVVLIYKKTPNGFENLDTNFELIKQSNGFYYSDLTSPKKDFHDYY